VGYKPKPKESLSRSDLKKFREGFSWHGKIVFDFLSSVPIQIGQLSKVLVVAWASTQDGEIFGRFLK